MQSNYNGTAKSEFNKGWIAAFSLRLARGASSSLLVFKAVARAGDRRPFNR